MLALGPTRVIAAGNRGLALLDPAALPAGGTQSYLFRLTGVNARNVYAGPGPYLFVNLNRGEDQSSHGFAVVERQGDTLALVTVRDEPGVLYEKMAFADPWLYVAAHRQGLRIFDVSDPAAPVLVGTLGTGFTDAWAVAVDGDTLYVADGAGGLKVVDVTDRTAPVLVAGETVDSARGTAEDVVVREGRVYVAAGGAGVAAYLAGELASRRLHAGAAGAKDLDWVGDTLAVAQIDGLSLWAPEDGTELRPVAAEQALRRGPAATLRLCSAVVGLGPNRVLAANWNYVDLYQLQPQGASVQPDLDLTPQRIRFHRDGGSRQVVIANDGAAPLTVYSVASTQSSFVVQGGAGVVPPGGSATFDVTYLGGDAATGTGSVRVWSNDPDEAIVNLRVYGNTSYLDPGDPVPDFTRPTIRADGSTGSFTLSAHLGQAVWDGIFASW